MAVVTKVYQLTMKFSGEQQGVSESVYLPDATRPAAIAAAKRVLAYRLACLSKALTCDFARVSEWGGSRDSSIVADAFPITGAFPGSGVSSPPATDLGPNLISDALTIRLETEDGLWANRWLHGVPDDKVFLDELVDVYTARVADPTADPAANSTFVQALADYLSVIMQKTVFFRHRGTGADLIRETFPLTKVAPVHLIAKKVGRPFRQQRGRATPR